MPHLMIPETLMSHDYMDNDIHVSCNITKYISPVLAIDPEHHTLVVKYDSVITNIHFHLIATETPCTTHWTGYFQLSDDVFQSTSDMSTSIMTTIFHSSYHYPIISTYSWNVKEVDTYVSPGIFTQFATALNNLYHKHLSPYLPIKEVKRVAALKDTARKINIYRFLALQFNRASQEQRAAARITRMFKAAFTNPEHPMCRKRLLREFDELAQHNKRRRLT